MTDEKMNNLADGDSLGRYRILRKLGAGGMGEVYLAHDTKLERSVALKVLPSDVASNEERMRRFTQEAKAAAALNHPNIAHIYEIGESGGTRFIAMEFVDGVTLYEKIHREKTPLRKLLKYLMQTAEGLAKAHAAGIVHRDLKPDNIMIARDDYAKILDFGLAKLIEPPRASGAENDASSEIATAILAQPLSTPGMIMGTAGYMSPEQAQGKVREIDHRSDIFSFGCILYEAATGRKAFAGKDALDSLHKIVHSPTPQIRDVNPDAPPELQRIVRRCLAKEPDKRYQSIKDVAIELDELRQELKDNAALEYSVQPNKFGVPPGTSPGVLSEPPAVAGGFNSQNADAKTQILEADTTAKSLPPEGGTPNISSAEYLVSGIKSHQKSAAIVLAVLVIALGGIAFALYKFLGKADKTPQAIKIERLTTNGKSTTAAISPDGKYVVYSIDEGGQHSLWVRQVAASSSVQIIPPAEDVYYWGLTFSPDSNYINFAKVQFEKNVDWVLYQMPVLGGTQKKLITHAQGGISYSPDGKQFAFVREEYPSAEESSLLIANADGTGERILASRKTPETFPSRQVTPAWSPDGKTIACIVSDETTGVGRMDVVEVNVADGTIKPVTTQKWEYISQIAWLQDKSGLLILGLEKASAFYAVQIWHFSYPEGEARRITTDFNNYASMSLTADSNALVTVQSNTISNIWVAPNGDANRALQIKSGGNNEEGIYGLAWTPDGRVVYSSLASGALNIWIMKADGTGQKQLTVDAGVNFRAKVTPDGRYIVFASIRNDQGNIWRMNLDGSNPKQLTNGNSDWNPAVTPDSRWVIYMSQRKPYLWKVSIDGGNAAQLIDKNTHSPEVSPDGKWIVCSYRKDDNSTWRYAIIPYEGGEPIKVFDLLGKKGNFRWSPDGRSLYYLRDTSGGVTNIWSFPLDDKPPKQLTNFKTEQIYNFAWSPDGKQLVLARGTTTSDVVLIKDFR
ncbi:MAG: protein kinase domain-containing protein [Pyrinomonadaceae bacterium]